MNIESRIAGQGRHTELRNGFIMDWDVAIEMDDGIVLRANVYRPNKDGRFPVIMSMGPYAKDLAWQDGYPSVWELFSKDHPDAIAGSSNVHQSWETVDPEHWVPEGYAVVRVDSRGAGRSPGKMDCFSPRESKDFATCIEWAADQAWSNGKVGLSGISYYAINQWHVAGLRPRGLAALCAWEGAADHYRDMSHQGGMLTTFLSNWYDMQAKTVQHGLGENGPRSRVNGELACGPDTLTEKQLARNRTDYGKEVARHPFDDHWHAGRSADWRKVRTPLLSAASWGGQGLHPRGNYAAFTHAATRDKWLECHGQEHWTEFYTPYGKELQKAFFGHFLKGENTGWTRRPRVMLRVRHVGEKFVDRGENEWPLKRTKWTRFHLDPKHMTLERKPPQQKGKVSYKGMSSDGVTFFMPPWDKDVEITGPLTSKLFVSSDTEDADLFLVVRLFTPDMKEITFRGTVDPHTPIAQGWLRASHRKLDKKRSTFWQPYHTHDKVRPLKPGKIYELDIEVWPTCIVVPAGYRLALTVRGKDYVWPGSEDAGGHLSNFKNKLTGCGPFLHDDPKDRPARVFDGTVTVHGGPKHASWLMLPVIPARKSGRSRKA